MKTGKMVILAVVLFMGTNLFAVTLPFEDGFENISEGDYPDENGWQNLFSGKTAYVWYDPDTAKNNQMIAYGREVNGGVTSSREIYLLDPITMAETRLTNNSWEEGWPAISPDGKKIAYTSKQDGNHEIYVWNVDGSGVPLRLTDNPAADGGVSWSPDGVYIAFQSDRDGNAEIYIVKANGSEPPENKSNHSATDADPYWSPDGKQIIFVSDRGGNQDIWVMDRDGSNLQNLTNHAGIDGAPAYSPNGDKIVFMSDRDGNREIYVMCYDGSAQTRLTNSSTWEENPDWSPDGKEIVYHSHQYGANIWKMNADGSNKTRLTTFSGDTWPSWGAELDGKSFRLISKPTWSRMDYVALPELPDRLTYEVSVYADPVAGRTIWVGFVEKSENYGLCYNRFQIKNIDGTNGEVYFNTGIGGDPSVLLGGFTIGEWVTVRADLDFVRLKANLWLNEVLKASDVDITSKEFDDPTWGYIKLNKWGVTEYNWAGGGTGTIYIDDVKLDYTGNLIKNGDFTYDLDNWVFVDKCQKPFGHNRAWIEDGKLWIESYKSGYGPGYVVQVLDRYILPKRFRIEYHQVVGQGCGAIGFGLDSGGIDELHNTGKPLTYWVGEHDADGDYAWLRVCEDNPHLKMATHDKTFELGIFEAVFNYDTMEIYVSVTCSSGTHYATVPISSMECALTNTVWACAVNPCSDGRNYETGTFDKIILEGYEISQEYHVNGQCGNDSWSGISQICESPDGPKKTIQAGIDATLYKDTVMVWPGVYQEDVSFLGKAITVKSAADAAHIIANGLYAVSFINGEDENSVLENFVIRDSGTGIQCVASDPTIRFVTVVNCEQGIWADQGADPTVSNSILWDNANADLINTTASYSKVQSELCDVLDGLVGYWRFDEENGSGAKDSSCNENHGTVSGATWTTGQIGGALDFDGTNDYVQTTNDDSLDLTEALTIAAWIKLNETVTDNSRIVCKRVDVSGDGYQLQVDTYADWRLHASMRNNDDCFSDEPIEPNVWTHVAVTYDWSETEVKVYVNGIEAGNMVPTQKVSSNSVKLHIGRQSTGGNQFAGKIDEVIVVNRALIPEEIQQIYADGAAHLGLGDPVFADPVNGDYHLLSERGRYHPVDPNHPVEGYWLLDELTSPCVDAGDAGIDASEEPAPNGGIVNIGAYGATGYASRSMAAEIIGTWPLRMDCNLDGIVNLLDFACLADEWLEEIED